jgi:hypothetical protein
MKLDNFFISKNKKTPNEKMEIENPELQSNVPWV